MSRPCAVLPLLLLVAALGLPAVAAADVVVIANRTKEEVTFLAIPPGNKVHKLAGGDLAVIPTMGKIHVAFAREGQRITYLLDANTAHYFGITPEGKVDLRQIGLGGDEYSGEGTRLVRDTPQTEVGTVPVKILVDEDERAARRVWEARLRKRLDTVSDLLEKYCRLRLEIVAIEEWESDDRIKDFAQSLAEFEREVQAGPAAVAIGFTSQYSRPPKGQTHLGGTRGPFHSHILIREWSQHISEAERVEVLLHELGHVLGCAHSPEPDSVMRPLLGDRKARRAEFIIKFDPPNTLAMNLVAEELRARGVRSFADLSSGTRYRLRQIYAAMDQSLPKDEAARAYNSMLSRASLASLSVGTREVVRNVVRAASSNAQRELAEDQASAGSATRLTGDALTDLLVRQAAWAANSLPPDEAATMFLLGIGIALDDSEAMRKNPQLRDFCRLVERDQEREHRLSVLGKPTMQGRRDLAQHFVVSAYLALTVGPKAAEAAGTTKELLDAQGKSGFSFTDVAANKAGIKFAEALARKKISLLHVANEFSVEYYVPAVAGLPEGLSWKEFKDQFGSFADERFQQVMQDIEARIDALPPYRSKLSSPQVLHQ